MCLQVHADDRALFAIRISLLRVHIFPSAGWTCCQSRIKTLLLSQILYNKQRKNTPTVVSRVVAVGAGGSLLPGDIRLFGSG